MRFSETWLREWVNPKCSREALSAILTNAGLEVEDITPAAEPFTGVVVGQIINLKQHPNLSDLIICDVNIAESNLLTIVTAAKNIKKGMKVAIAKVNAVLADNSIISSQAYAGVISQGVLLSSKELGLTEDNEEALELPQNSSLGEDLWRYFKLDDHIFDLAITPNRGDCLSIKGIAREVAALTKTAYQEIKTPDVKVDSPDILPITVKDKAACPHYVGRIIHHVKANALVPVWIKERLRRSGVRSINAVVDIVNYVMFELGQPMHAFDLNRITHAINVRHAKDGESIYLLNNSEVALNSETLVIADEEKPLAIAGLMGGMDSAVTTQSKSIFLESAFFTPETVSGARQRYNITSDSGYRYERGVDPAIQNQAIERATQLIIEICGGNAGPRIDLAEEPTIVEPTIALKKPHLTQCLGIIIPDDEIDTIFEWLQFEYKKIDAITWEVKRPSFRFDITIPEDLIEEIARVYGYDKIPVNTIRANLAVSPSICRVSRVSSLQRTLCNLGYHEIVTYSFIDKALQALIDPEKKPRSLRNPMSNDMAVMRTSLWPGLINTFLYNADRQQTSVRLFELGKVFLGENDGQYYEKLCLSGLLTGLRLPEQWGAAENSCDFYDLKGHLSLLLEAHHIPFSFVVGEHFACHPGQTALIKWQNNIIGIMGALHPNLASTLDIKQKVFLFDLYLDLIIDKEDIIAKNVSKFPEIRRDLALLINEAVPAQKIQDTIKGVAGDWLKNSFIFDVYQGKGISSGYKSIAVALILQHPLRTLTDAEIAELIDRVILALKEQLGAELRS